MQSSKCLQYWLLCFHKPKIGAIGVEGMIQYHPLIAMGMEWCRKREGEEELYKTCKHI